MRKLMAIALLILMAGFALSQGYGPCGYGCFNWDSEKLILVEGELTSVAPTQVKLKAANGKVYTLHMGPFWYMSRIGLELSPGIRLKVKGYLIQNSTGYHLCVAEAILGGKTYRLRDRNGRPLWWNYRGRGNRTGWGSSSSRGSGRGRRGSGRW